MMNIISMLIWSKQCDYGDNLRRVDKYIMSNLQTFEFRVQQNKDCGELALPISQLKCFFRIIMKLIIMFF